MRANRLPRLAGILLQAALAACSGVCRFTQTSPATRCARAEGAKSPAAASLQHTEPEHVPVGRSSEWPTTLRFSRRLGEAVRGADYAAAIEGPEGRTAPCLDANAGRLHPIRWVLGRLR